MSLLSQEDWLIEKSGLNQQHGHLLNVFLENETPTAWSMHHFNENDYDFNQVKVLKMDVSYLKVKRSPDERHIHKRAHRKWWDILTLTDVFVNQKRAKESYESKTFQHGLR